MNNQISSFLADLLRQVANPFGRPGERIQNRVGNFAFESAFNNAMGGPKKKPDVSSRDAAIDDIVRKYSLETAGGALRAGNAGKKSPLPPGMSYDEGAVRAFIKISEKNGLTLEDIKTLLESEDGDPTAGKGGMHFSFKAMSEEAKQLFEKIKDDFTSANLDQLLPEIGKEQTKQERKKRAESEPADFFKIKPSKQMDAMLNSLAEMLGGKTLRDQKEKEKQGLYGIGDTESRILKALRRSDNPEDQAEADRIQKAQDDRKLDSTPLSKALSAFADLMGIAQAGDDVKELAGTDLKQAIDKLVTATVDNTKATSSDTKQKSSKKTSRLNSAVRAATRWLGRNSAKAGIRGLGAVSRGIMSLVPRKFRAGVQRWGAGQVAGFAQNLGVNPLVAARFGAALGTAAPAMMILARAIPIVGAGFAATVKALKLLANNAWQATQALASYNSNLAFASATLNFNREMRKIQAAQAIAAGGFFEGKDRIQAEDRMEQAMQPFVDAMHVMGNDIGTAATLTLASILESVNMILALMAKGGNIAKIPAMAAADAIMPGLGRVLGGLIGQQNGNNQVNANPIGGLMGLGGQGAVDQEELARRIKNRPRNPLGPQP